MGTSSESVPFEWPLYLSELETKENEMLEIHIKNCGLDIWRQKDEKGFTLLHHAVLKCIPGKIEKLISLAKKIQKAEDADIKEWVNSRTMQD